jgi:hypothetical protein
MNFAATHTYHGYANYHVIIDASEDYANWLSNPSVINVI